MKLCWGMISRPEALWVRCLKSKYNCGSEKFPKVERRKNQSAVWGAISAVWKDFRKGVGSKLRSGRDTSAWWELWTPLEQPLIHYVDKNPEFLNPEDRVRDFVLANGSWDLSKWSSFLPNWVVDKINLVQPPIQEGVDRFTWRVASDGNFNIRAAYNMIRKMEEEQREPFWQQIWRWSIPERAKLFMWQTFHERLPTNVFRAKCGISESNECPFECNSEESVIHTLRDCELASNVWSYLINPVYHSTFFSGNLQVWLRWNIRSKPATRRFANWPWTKVFSTMCWLIWKNRCRRAFEGEGEQAVSIIQRFQYHLLEGVEQGRYKHQIFQIPERSASKWQSPPGGYVRVDVDGSVNEVNQAACGGIIRDSNGSWIRGFQQKLGYCCSTMAEIYAIKVGIQTCKSLGLKKVKLYSDSLEAIQLL